MTLFGFGEKADAESAKRIARRARSTPQRTTLGYKLAFPTNRSCGQIDLPAAKIPNIRAYVAVPKDTIPGCSTRGDAIVPGKGQAYVYRQPTDSDLLRQHFSVRTGKSIEKTVFNLCPEAIEAGYGVDASGSGDAIASISSGCLDTIVLFVVEDMWGDLYIVKVCELPCTSSSSSSISSSSLSSSSGSSSSVSSSLSSAGSSLSSLSESFSESVSVSESISISASDSGCATCFRDLCVSDLVEGESPAWTVAVDDDGCIIKADVEGGPIVDVITGVRRSGDDFCFSQKRIWLPAGTKTATLTEFCLNVCCEDEASDGSSESADSSTSGNCAACSGDTPDAVNVHFQGVFVFEGGPADELNDYNWPLTRTGPCTWEITQETSVSSGARALPQDVQSIELIVGVEDEKAWAEITVITDGGEATFTFDSNSATFDCANIGSFTLGGVSDNSCYIWINADADVGWGGN